MHNITAAVVEEFLAGGDSGLKTILLNSLVSHLQLVFLREDRPSQREWTTAIEFLTKTGQML